MRIIKASVLTKLKNQNGTLYYLIKCSRCVIGTYVIKATDLNNKTKRYKCTDCDTIHIIESWDGIHIIIKEIIYNFKAIKKIAKYIKSNKEVKNEK